MDNVSMQPAADPFAPVAGMPVEIAGSKPKEIWEPQIPAPFEPPLAAQIHHAAHGIASHRWVYRDARGAALFAVVRFDIDKGEGRSKEILPYSYGRRVWTTKTDRRKDVTDWHFKRPAAPVPLYGLDRLSAHPEAVVLVCEGEKAADAAQVLFPDLVTVASQGGSKAAAKSDWSPLANRDVVIWPDHDKAGALYVADAAAAIRELGGLKVRRVTVPKDWPEGWDLADDLPEGAGKETLLGLLQAAEVPAGEEPEAESEQPSGPSPEDAAVEVERLSRLPQTEYARARKRSAAQLVMGVGDLDKAVAAQKAKRRAIAEAEHRAKPAPEPGETHWPIGIVVGEDGLYFDGGGDAGLEWVCAPLEVLGQGRDAAGESWGLWLKWRDSDHRVHTWPMPAKLLVAQQGELEAALIDRGLRMSIELSARQRLRSALNEVRSGSRVSLADTPGWCAPASGESAFVLIDGTIIGSSSEEIVLKAAPENASIKMASAGTLEGWKKAIAAKANGNPVAAFTICAAFAGPLLEPLGESSGGFHFHGRSKEGKTLALKIGISVWGAPKKAGLLKDWRSTANALEGAAEESTDGFLTLDEIHQAEPRDVVQAVYQIANESGKQRLNRDASSKRRRTWRTIVISTGEIDIATMAAKASSSPLPAGAEVRLPSVPIDGQVMWPDLHGETSSSALMASLQEGLLSNYGAPIRAFLAKLTEVRSLNDGALEATFDATRSDFYSALEEGADAQVRDVARRCALIALAGEMAVEWDILPWEFGDATKAVKTILNCWINRRGGSGSTEESQHVRAVRAYLSEYGASRFTVLDLLIENGRPNKWVERHPDKVILTRTGWRRQASEDTYEFLLDKDGWHKLCAERAADPAEVAKTLAKEGHLSPGDGKNLTKLITIPNIGRIRCYVVLPSIFGEAAAATDEPPAEKAA